MERLESSFSGGEVGKQENGISDLPDVTHRNVSVHWRSFGLDKYALHTWEVKHFFQVVRIAGLHSMTSPQLLQQLVSLCLRLPETLLQLGQLQCRHTTQGRRQHPTQSYKCGTNLDPMNEVGVLRISCNAVPPSWQRGRSVAVAPKL